MLPCPDSDVYLWVFLYYRSGFIQLTCQFLQASRNFLFWFLPFFLPIDPKSDRWISEWTGVVVLVWVSGRSDRAWTLDTQTQHVSGTLSSLDQHPQVERRCKQAWFCGGDHWLWTPCWAHTRVKPLTCKEVAKSEHNSETPASSPGKASSKWTEAKFEILVGNHGHGVLRTQEDKDRPPRQSGPAYFCQTGRGFAVEESSCWTGLPAVQTFGQPKTFGL